MIESKIAYNVANASYGSVKHHEKLVNMGYKLDHDLTNDRNRVYVLENNDLKKPKVLLGYRGTDPASRGDISSDLSIIAGMHKYDSAFKDAENFYKLTKKKYKTQPLVSGHSLGGSKVIHVGKKFKVKKSFAFQPGSGPLGLHPGSTRVYASDFDPVSAYISRVDHWSGVGHDLSNFEYLNE